MYFIVHAAFVLIKLMSIIVATADSSSLKLPGGTKKLNHCSKFITRQDDYAEKCKKMYTHRSVLYSK